MFKVKSTFLVLTLVAASPVYSMYYNAGYSGSFNNKVSTFKCVNDGTIAGFNSVELDVTTLSGSGTISGKWVTIACKEYNFGGTVSASEACVIRAKKFEEAGKIESPKLTIICDTCNFKGTIACEKECTIYAKEPFKYSQFKRTGAGQVTVIICKNDVKLCTQEGLLADVTRTLRNNCLNLTQESIDATLKEMRTTAVLNKIADKSVLEQLRKNIEIDVNYRKDRLDQTRDTSALYKGLAFCGAGTAGLGVAYSLYRYRGAICKKMNVWDADRLKLTAGLVGAFSTIPFALSWPSFREWLNPQHKEKYEKFLLISDRIDHALKTPRIAEEQIIKL